MPHVYQRIRVLRLSVTHKFCISRPRISGSSRLRLLLRRRLLSASYSASGAGGESLIVTLELHVRKDVDDEDVLKLTRWTWERCIGALGGGIGKNKVLTEGGPEVTVGVVRG